MIELFFLLPAAIVILGVISVVLDRRDRNEKEEGIFKDTQWEYEKKGY